MTRAQVVIDEQLLELAKAAAKRQRRSFSELVREALSDWLAKQDGDTSWMASIPSPPGVDHDWDAVEGSIAQGMAGAQKMTGRAH